MRTWGGIKNQLIQAAGGDETLEPILRSWFNAAQRAVARYYRFPELACETEFSVTAGTRYYVLENDVLEWQSLHIYHESRWKRMAQVPLRKWWQDYEPNVDVRTGRPREYCLWGRSLRLYPLPDQTYTLKYFATVLPTDVLSDSSVVVLETALEGVVALALGLYFDSIEELQTASMWKKLAEAFLKQFKVADLYKVPLTQSASNMSKSTSLEEAYKIPFK